MKTHIFWLCLSVTAFFVGTQFAKKQICFVEKPVEITKTVSTVLTQIVERKVEIPVEVEKIVVKRVEVPSEIPDSYKMAKWFYDSFFTTNTFEKNEILKGISGVNVGVLLDDDVKSRLSKQELKDSIELALRKNGVPVNDKSDHWLLFTVDGVWDNENIRYSYRAAMSLNEWVSVPSSGEFKLARLKVWESGFTGFAGSQKVAEGITRAVDKLVISFSNAYLGANPK